jgi:hypothetical protein
VTKKKPRCLICKYTKPDLLQPVEPNTVYPAPDKSIRIHLCDAHSVELFKSGQITFLVKYYPMFLEYYGNEEDTEIIAYAKSLYQGDKPQIKKSPY